MKDYKEPFIFRHLGKIMLVSLVLIFVGISVFFYAVLTGVQKCNPSVIHQTVDGKDVTSLGCKP